MSRRRRCHRLGLGFWPRPLPRRSWLLRLLSCCALRSGPSLRRVPGGRGSFCGSPSRGTAPSSPVLPLPWRFLPSGGPWRCGPWPTSLGLPLVPLHPLFSLRSSVGDVRVWVGCTPPRRSKGSRKGAAGKNCEMRPRSWVDLDSVRFPLWLGQWGEEGRGGSGATAAHLPRIRGRRGGPL